MGEFHPHVVSSSVLLNYRNGKFSQVEEQLNDLPNEILEYMRTSQSSVCVATFYEELYEIFLAEINDEFSLKNLSLICPILLSFRNSFYKSEINQRTFANNTFVMDSVIDLLKRLCDTELMTRIENKTKRKYTKVCTQDEVCTQEKVRSKKVDTEEVRTQEEVCTQTEVRTHTEIWSQPENETECEWVSELISSTSACVTCLSNLMAGNSKNSLILAPRILPTISVLLSHPDVDISQKASSLLHHFLINPKLGDEILDQRPKVFNVTPLLRLYLHDGQYSCFVLFCLEKYLASEAWLSDEWESLDERLKLIALDVLTSIVVTLKGNKHSRNVYLHPSVICFVRDSFKIEADKILCTKNLESLQPRVLTRLSSFLSSCAASDVHQVDMQEDRSVLVSSIYLLKALTVAGNEGSGNLSRLADLSDTDKIEEEAMQNPLFGFKTDLIKLVAGLVYRNSVNQDMVRDMNGILLLLENSQYDGKNPLIREASILAIRNLLEGNTENQKVVKDLECHSGVKSPLLEQMGAKVSLEDGKPKIVSDK